MNPTRNTPEIWKPVVGYEDLYEVSDHGRIRSLGRELTYKDGRRGRLPGKMRKISNHNQGYSIISFRRDGVAKTSLVHRVVLEAFVGPCPEGMEACHRDGDRKNNQLSNLRWDSSSENNLDKGRIGRDHNRNKTHCPRGHALEDRNNRGTERRAGRRCCLACDRAHSHIYRHPEDRTRFQEIADLKYREIVS